MNRISELTRSGLASPGVAIDRGQAKNRADSLFPFGDDRVEVLVDYVGDIGARLQALGLIAVDGSEQSAQKLVDFF